MQIGPPVVFFPCRHRGHRSTHSYNSPWEIPFSGETRQLARILVIDDEEQVRNLLRLALQREGYEVVLAKDGEEGLRLFRKDPADLIITDIIMPEREGLEIIQELRKDFPQAKIIAISGADQTLMLNVLDISKRFGAIRTFRKPFEIKEVVQTVRELVPGVSKPKS